MSTDPQHLRIVEALLFAAPAPMDEETLAGRLPEGADLMVTLAELAAHYDGRGVNLVRVAGRWAFRTAPDLAGHLQVERTVTRRLSRAAVETLAIVAYHQPVTRAEIEEIRGVSLNKGTLDVLLESGWIRPGRRRHSPGRPVTWVTTPAFLEHFSLDGLQDLPGVEELRAAGLLDTRPAASIVESLTYGEGADEAAGAVLADEDTAHAEDIGRPLDPEEDEDPR